MRELDSVIADYNMYPRMYTYSRYIHELQTTVRELDSVVVDHIVDHINVVHACTSTL